MRVKTINLLCYYVLPLLAFAVYIVEFIVDSSTAYRFSRAMGEWAWYLLLIIVFMKPIKTLFPKFRFINKIFYRKQLGVLATYLFLVHAIGGIIRMDAYSLSDYVGFSNYLFWGLLGGIVMIILGLTSNVYSLKKLNSLFSNGWKKLHRIAYLLVIFVMIHAYLVSQDISYLIITAIYVILKVLEFSRVVLWK